VLPYTTTDEDLEELLASAAGPREHVSLAEAARRLSVPYATIRSWKHRHLVARSGIDRNGNDVYDLATIRRLAESTKRRKHRAK